MIVCLCVCWWWNILKVKCLRMVLRYSVKMLLMFGAVAFLGMGGCLLFVLLYELCCLLELFEKKF